MAAAVVVVGSGNGTLAFMVFVGGLGLDLHLLPNPAIAASLEPPTTHDLGPQSTTPCGKVTIDIGEYGFCQQFAGEYPAAETPWPAYHPSCTCTASAV